MLSKTKGKFVAVVLIQTIAKIEISAKQTSGHYCRQLTNDLPLSADK